MEDETYHTRPYLAPAATGDYVLQMEPDSTASTPPPIAPSGGDNKPRKNSTEADVCYPYQPQLPDQHSSIEVEALKAYRLNVKEDESKDPDYKLERQMTAKLDDLLDSNNEKGSMSRRFSLYGENTRVSFLISNQINIIHDILNVSLIRIRLKSIRMSTDILFTPLIWDL